MDLKGLKIVVFKEDLEIHYCDPLTLETVHIKRFKTIEDLEEYLYNANR
jgi:hypothetical protein